MINTSRVFICLLIQQNIQQRRRFFFLLIRTLWLFCIFRNVPCLSGNKCSRYTPVSSIISYTPFRYIPFFCHFSNWKVSHLPSSFHTIKTTFYGLFIVIIQKLHLLWLVYYIIGNKSTRSYLLLLFLPIKILIKSWILLPIKQYPVSLILFFIPKPTHTQYLFLILSFITMSARESLHSDQADRGADN